MCSLMKLIFYNFNSLTIITNPLSVLYNQQSTPFIINDSQKKKFQKLVAVTTSVNKYNKKQKQQNKI